MHSIIQRSQVETILAEFSNFECSRDRMYTINPLMDTLKFLLNHNIKDVSDITSLLTRTGFKSKEIIECIKVFVKDYNDSHKEQTISWFNTRSFRQLSYYHKNFVIARLVYEHGQILLAYFRNYVKIKLSNEEDIENFINEMKLKFDKIIKQADYAGKELQTEPIELNTIDHADILNCDTDDISEYFTRGEDDENLEYELLVDCQLF